MKTVDEIHSLYTQRRSSRAPTIARMAEIRETYNGDLTVDLPELSENEKAAVANLAQVGVDQTAMRVASTIAAIHYPPLRPGIKVSERKARTRRDVNLGWWEQNRIPLKMRRRARWLLGYGCAPVTLRPGTDRQPVWHLRDPLTTYPADSLDWDDLVPPDCIFAYKRGRTWLERNYPDQMGRLHKNDESVTFTVLEYVDADEITLLVVGDEPNLYRGTRPAGAKLCELHRVPNRAERPLSVIPGRVTLDRTLGQFDGMIGMYLQESKLMALYTHAVQRSIFPPVYLEGSGPGDPEVLEPAEPEIGQMGRVKGGSIRQIQMGASPFAASLIDRFEYAQRHTGGVPAEFGGQAGSNIRTGRRGEQVLSAVVDYTVQEAQAVFEESLREENKTAIALTKAYGGSRSFSFYVTGRGLVEWSPSVFETDCHEVRYAYTGADANGVTIQVGQKLGLETMSRETAMGHDPMVRDVEAELDKIRGERAERAFEASIETMASTPGAPLTPTDLALYVRLVKSDQKEPFEAFEEVQKRAQERQAELAQAEADQMPGVDIPDVERPELAPVGAPGEGVGNFASLMGKLRLPNMQIDQERAVGLPAGPA